jgi:fatty-acyl-CoA synthase
MAPTPETIIDCLARHYHLDQHKVFCHFLKDGQAIPLTFGTLLHNAMLYTQVYADRGLQPADSVLIILRHTPDLLYSFVGALLGGFIPSILAYPTAKQDPGLYWTSHQRLVERLDSKVIVTYRENDAPLARFVDLNRTDVVLAEDLPTGIEAFGPIPEFATVKPESVAFLQHTSGTTGLKKGIALSHRAVLRQIEQYGATLRLTPDDLIASWLPLYHDMGLIACFILPLVTGIPVALMDPFEWVYQPDMLFETISRYRATLVWLPNFSFQHLCQIVGEDADHDLSSVRAFINCSEPCKPATFAAFLKTFQHLGVRREQLQTCYAMAETVFAVTQSPLGAAVPVLCVDLEEFQKTGRAVPVTKEGTGIEYLSVGRPLPDMSVQIVDRERRPVADGQVGEIAVSSPYLFSGYYRAPSETEAVLQEGWYYTGDLGFLLDGELFVTGRIKDILIVNGRNFYAHDIEFVATRVPEIKKGRAVALGIYNDIVGSEEVVLVAESLLTDPVQKRELVRRVRELVLSELNLYLRDVHLVPLEWILKTTSGKIDRAENKKKYLEEVAGALGSFGQAA